jgi:16S rRNA (guanine527-N7)-methyltransferase
VTDASPATDPAPAPPPAAADLFGARLPLAEAYTARLAGDGVLRGLIGPREVVRLWDRHLVNSAVLTDLVPPGARIVDVGSGAGLPGIPMGIRRPDLRIQLLEPMQRRIEFLCATVSALGLANSIEVIRGRAEEKPIVDRLGGADRVVARAVAPLDRLVKWCLPLVAPGGVLLALKGATARNEVAQHRAAIRRLGADQIDVHTMATPGLESTWVVSVRRAASVRPQGQRKGGR